MRSQQCNAGTARAQPRTHAGLAGIRLWCMVRAGLTDPNPFFQALLRRPYLNNVVIAPHYYPPSISEATDKCAHPRQHMQDWCL